MISETFLEYYSIVSTALLVVTPYITYRLTGPRISVRPRIVERDGKNYLTVEVNNNGSAAAKIDITEVKLFYFYGERQIREYLVEPKFEGPDLPHRLDSHSFETWRAPADFLNHYPDLRDPDNSISLRLKIGGHRRRYIRIRVADPIVVSKLGRPL